MSTFRTAPLQGGNTDDRLPHRWTPPSAREGMRERIVRIGQRLQFHRKRQWRKRLWWLVAALVAGTIAYGAWLIMTLPDVSDPRSLIADQSSVITDRNGVELYRLFDEQDRTFIEGNAIPLQMKEAIVAIEDERFYTRGCLDIRALARILFRFGQAGGASTLTRQLARNALDLTQENIVSRKLKELILGCTMEKQYTKEELLDLYLNWIPFGRNVYGIEQASNAYFGKSASGLTLAEAAVLASLPQRPSYFSPYGNHIHTDVTDKALQRIISGSIRTADDLHDEDVIIGLIGANIGTGATVIRVGGRTDQVLYNMQERGDITEQERLAALEELSTMTFQPLRETIRAPHFVLWVRQFVEDLFSEGTEEDILDRGGLHIETTLDWTLQQAAERAVAVQQQDLVDRFEAHNVSLVALDPVSRDILAYVGNTDYSDEEHNGKVDMARAARQPGSTFKPFVYAAAFGEGYSPATVLYDVPTKFGDDQPQNYDGGFMGLINARHALAGSRNVPAIKAFYLLPQDNREDRILDLVARLGAPTPLRTKEATRAAQAEQGIPEDERFNYGYPLAIGAAETPLLEMVEGYAAFADGGRAKPVQVIRRILDRNGNIVWEPQMEDAGEVFDPRVAYQITSILSDVSARPNEYWQTVLSVPGWEAAGKTGTSNKCLERYDTGELKGVCKERRPSDLWTLGYTPAIVAGVWVGNADGSALSPKAESLITAAPIWKNFMVAARNAFPDSPTTFPQPEGLVFPQVSTLSGELPTECTPVELRQGEVFREEFAPTQPDPACASLEIDKITGFLASDSCPAEARGQQHFLIAHSILADRWPQWEQGVQEWTADQMARWNAAPDHSGSLLPLPLAPTDVCDIRSTPGRLTKPTVHIETPTDGSVMPYPAFRPKLQISSGSPVREVRYEVDGKLVATGSGSERTTIVLPRSIKQGGTHRLTVTVIDTWFNAASDATSLRFTDDRDAPQVRIVPATSRISLPSGATLSLRADAGDGDGGIKYVQFFLGTRLLTTKPTLPYLLQYSAEIRPGDYVLRAVATDYAGNEGEDSIELTITP